MATMTIKNKCTQVMKYKYSQTGMSDSWSNFTTIDPIEPIDPEKPKGLPAPITLSPDKTYILFQLANPKSPAPILYLNMGAEGDPGGTTDPGSYIKIYYVDKPECYYWMYDRNFSTDSNFSITFED